MSIDILQSRVYDGLISSGNKKNIMHKKLIAETMYTIDLQLIQVDASF